ncbi:hypothetical protein K7432_009702 [Basidiobolus ranarum]|uniref:Uncharacterized protein n=1 Tax=Basidiobolus ranarum TaxID=34480 RepID=A0ABR2VWN7_9FUNG
MKITITVTFIVALLSNQLLLVSSDNVEKCLSHSKEKTDNQQLMSCATDCIGVPNPSPEDVKRTAECTKKCGSNVNCHIGCIREYFQKGNTEGAYTGEYDGKDNSHKDVKKHGHEKEDKNVSTSDHKQSKGDHNQAKPEKEAKVSTEVSKSLVGAQQTSGISAISPSKTSQVAGASTIVPIASTPAPFSVPSAAFPFSAGFSSNKAPFSSFSSSKPNKTGTRSASSGSFNAISLLSTFLIPWISYRGVTA